MLPVVGKIFYVLPVVGMIFYVLPVVGKIFYVLPVIGVKPGCPGSICWSVGPACASPVTQHQCHHQTTGVLDILAHSNTHETTLLQCLVLQNFNLLPLSVHFLCLCENVNHKQEVCFLLYVLDQIVTLQS